jgi:hypothetical protein
MDNLFIDIAYIRTYTVIDENTDSKMIEQAILRAQRFFIRPILGTDLYNAINTKVGAVNVTGDYLTLLDQYIAPALAQYTVVESMFPMWIKHRNKTIAIQGSDNAQPVDNVTFDKAKEYYDNIAQQEKAYLEKYLCDFGNLFPEYLSNADTGDVGPQNSGFDSGIWLGGNNCNNYGH